VEAIRLDPWHLWNDWLMRQLQSDDLNPSDHWQKLSFWKDSR